MIFDPSIFTSLFTLLKDVGIVVGGATLAWKTFKALNAIISAATRIPEFMDTTTTRLDDIRNHAQLAVTNHLTHMEDGITKLAEAGIRQADQMDKFRGDLGKYIVDMSKSQAAILEQLRENNS